MENYDITTNIWLIYERSLLFIIVTEYPSMSSYMGLIRPRSIGLNH